MRTATGFIPFSVPYVTGQEISNLAQVVASDHTQGDGPFTEKATAKLKQVSGAQSALLTTSCSHALDMSLMLLQIGPGDEVVLPSFTFPSAGNSIAQRGATAVFVDCDRTTGNIDVEQAIAAFTPNTRAVIVMHYGGMPVDLDELIRIASARGIAVVEDAAHGLGVATNAGPLGTQGTFGTLSFHATKNIQSGEGGALLINDESYQLAAEIIREKGTNRSQFLRGAIDKYTWVDWGSSYLPSEYTSAVLLTQLEHFDEIQAQRNAIWNRYAAELQAWADERSVIFMTPTGAPHAAHLFAVLMPDADGQSSMLSHTKSHGVLSTFHYQPLHNSPAGERFGRTFGALPRTIDLSQRLVRLPLWAGMTQDQVGQVISAVTSWEPR